MKVKKVIRLFSKVSSIVDNIYFHQQHFMLLQLSAYVGKTTGDDSEERGRERPAYCGARE